MPQLPENFDPSSAPKASYKALPPGWYAMEIVASEIKTSRSGDDYIKLEFQPSESHHPEMRGRKVWANLNLYHSKDEVRAIAQRDLAAIAHAVNGPNCGPVKRTEDLHHKPMAVKLKVRPETNEFPESNEPCGYDDIASRFERNGSVSTPASKAEQEVKAAKAAPTKAPWAK